MSTANSGINCSNSREEAKASVVIQCPQKNNKPSYLRRLGESFDYIESVYNEVQGITLSNGTLREQWDNSGDPRFQQYNVDTGAAIFEN